MLTSLLLALTLHLLAIDTLLLLQLLSLALAGTSKASTTKTSIGKGRLTAHAFSSSRLHCSDLVHSAVKDIGIFAHGSLIDVKLQITCQTTDEQALTT